MRTANTRSILSACFFFSFFNGITVRPTLFLQSDFLSLLHLVSHRQLHSAFQCDLSLPTVISANNYHQVIDFTALTSVKSTRVPHPTQEPELPFAFADTGRVFIVFLCNMESRLRIVWQLVIQSGAGMAEGSLQLVLSREPVLLNHVSAFLRDHHCRRICIPADDGWHYRGINYA